jgi:hypothetical protein
VEGEGRLKPRLRAAECKSSVMTRAKLLGKRLAKQTRSYDHSYHLCFAEFFKISTATASVLLDVIMR